MAFQVEHVLDISRKILQG